MKTCSKCKEDKHLNHFYKDSTSKSGYRTSCKDCHYTPEQVRTKILKEYGLTTEDYSAMLKAQNNLCAICGNPETATYRGKTKALCVDHCHKTGEVRGLLCRECNLGVGYFQDAPNVLRHAIKYLS